MTRVRRYSAFLVGCLVLFGGAYEAFLNLDTTTLVIAWGVFAVLGSFPLAYGLSGVLRRDERSGRHERGSAPGKTTSYFGSDSDRRQK